MAEYGPWRPLGADWSPPREGSYTPPAAAPVSALAPVALATDNPYDRVVSPGVLSLPAPKKKGRLAAKPAFDLVNQAEGVERRKAQIARDHAANQAYRASVQERLAVADGSGSTASGRARGRAKQQRNAQINSAYRELVQVAPADGAGRGPEGGA